MRHIADLQTIPAVGQRTATELVDAGCTSVADMHLPQYNKMLTSAQRIGLLYLDHINEPVSREEAEDVIEFIRYHISSKFEVHLMGSYRRDSSTLSDIDVLLFHPSYIHIPTPRPSALDFTRSRSRGKQPHPFNTGRPTVAQRQNSPLIQDVVHPLEAAGLLATPLMAGPRKWQGVALLPKKVDGAWEEVGVRLRDLRAKRGVYRRLDLNLAPMKSRGAAMLALTGDVDFVRSLRVTACKLGMHLNEYGLWRWNTNVTASTPSASSTSTSPPSSSSSADEDEEQEQKETEDSEGMEDGFWELIEGENEEGIMRELGMNYVPPDKRNFRFLKGSKRGRPRKGR
ncbi:hypothetical protein EW146_g10317 [Bondarzewia mesenterica]|uniref:DNA-directed DNA polymerase X domain-containing protein n=1 Tax=Bondarzewia mesenterica TaxID=1095465 RepID=A0A4S4KYX7_9AGAM|nr:hypothetical protein EW146_g10317 [Bondarzewia mesenterica]